MANWSEINQDILSLIIMKITDSSDHIRISGVCSSWRCVAKQNRCNLPHPIPGLMIAAISTTGISKERKFLNYSSSLWSFDIDDVPRNHRCCGSHKGWIFLIKEDRNSAYLLNPFIKRRHLLPDLGPFAVNSNVGKAVISCSPSMDLKCVVLILFEKKGAAFCSLGDDSWTKMPYFCGYYDDYEDYLSHSCSAFSDALFFEGRFYVVDDYGRVYTCNLDRQFIEEVSSQPSDITKIRHKWYLLELKGEIHRVQRKFASNEGFYYENTIDVDSHYVDTHLDSLNLTRDFLVWKMDPGKKMWVRIRDLGVFALFLGCNNSVGISELEVFGIKGNRIYFTDDRHRTKHFGCVWPGKDMGIFDLENSSIKPLCWTQCEWLVDPPAVWVAPLPW